MLILSQYIAVHLTQLLVSFGWFHFRVVIPKLLKNSFTEIKVICFVAFGSRLKSEVRLEFCWNQATASQNTKIEAKKIERRTETESKGIKTLWWSVQHVKCCDKAMH